jgi:O-antigen/teichoic acid export membrane protein
MLKHPAVLTTVLMGSGGIASMLANILYAKQLLAEDFGRLMIMQAIAFVVMGLLPMGFDGLIARREVHAPLFVIRRVIAAGSAVALGILVIGGWLIEGNTDMAIFILFAGISGASLRLFAAIEQSEMNFLRTQIITQSPPLIFLVFACCHLMLGLRSWHEAGVAYALSIVLGALIGYIIVRHHEVPVTLDQNYRQMTIRALALIGILASILLLNQLPLFVAASVLSLKEVGALGLAIMLVVSPFRLLSHGVGYTLVPRMTGCENRASRRKLLAHEFLFAMGLGLLGAIALLVLVPPFVVFVFDDQYAISYGLVISLVVLGLIRLITAVILAAINAVAGAKILHLSNLFGWASALIAAGSALALSRYGASGIVSGVAIGWAARIGLSLLLLMKEVRD